MREHRDNPDDVDRLFARLERAAVPDDLTARVLASTVGRSGVPRAMLAWPWIVVGLVAVGLLTVAGYDLGASLAANDGLDVLAGVLADLGLLATSPGDVAAALGEVVPWSLVVIAGVSAAVLILAAGNVVSRPSPPLRTRRLV
jgi:hypothetical protein